MSKKDYYDLLGVGKDASQADIKKAFRKNAIKHHPDRNQGDKASEKKFKELNEAYEVLKDEQKRAAYDQYGHAAFENGGNGQGGFGGGGFQDMSDIFGDMFSDFMGGGQRQRAADVGKGSDLRYNVNISLEEAYTGLDKEIKYKTAVKCEPCGARGSKKPDGVTRCATCGGAGKVRAQQGFFVVEKACHSCGGNGKTVKDPCRSCNGQGRVVKEKKLSVSIPAGIDDSARIRASGEGEAGVRGAEAGDLYIFVSLKQHALFKRQEHMLFCQVPLKMTTAVLGGNVEVPTLDGKLAKVSIPAGTQTGAQFRLKGKGMPVLRSSRHGDMIIEVGVEIPVKLTTKQKKLLEEFNEESKQGSNPESESFFSKVKGFWK